MNYGLLFAELSKKRIRYLICGGLATNLYGLQRLTADIDIILDLDEDNLQKFQEIMAGLNYKPVLPINITDLADETKLNMYVEEKHLIAYSYFNLKQDFIQVDVITQFPFNFLEMWNRKKTDNNLGFDIYIIELNDLIEMKGRAGREQDLTDLIYLKKIRDEQ